MRETYQILTDHEGNAHILYLSGGVHAYLTHKQAKELAVLGNLEDDERKDMNRAHTAAVEEYKTRLADPADPISERAITSAYESIESHYLKIEIEQAQALIKAQSANIERLTLKNKELSDSLEALRAVYAAENPPSPEFSQA
jgi:hypothetical protein